MDIQENDRSYNRDNSIENEIELCKNKSNYFNLELIATNYIVIK